MDGEGAGGLELSSFSSVPSTSSVSPFSSFSPASPFSSLPSPALVGGEAERELPAAAVRAAREGQGPSVFVLGKAGIGKSRLVEEATSAAASTGARVPVRAGRVGRADGAVAAVGGGGVLGVTR